MRLRQQFSDPNLDLLYKAQAELDRRQRARMHIAAITQADRPKDAANDNLLAGFSMLPAFQFFIDQPLGSVDWRAAFSGRGDGKSWGAVDGAIYWAYHIPNLRVCCVRMKESDLELSMKALFPDRLKHWGLWDVVARWNNGKIVFDNGSEILFVGLWKGGKPEGVKSLEGANLTIIEEATEVSSAALDVLVPTVMRTELSEIWAIWNPKNKKDAIDALLRGEAPPERAIIRRIRRSDNPFFTDKNQRQMEADFKRRPIRAAHIWDGEYEPSAEGAMWDRAMLDIARENGQRLRREMIQRIVLAVDPNGSGPNQKDSDEVGIVVAAEITVPSEIIVSSKVEPFYVVLGDYSMGKVSPREWALKVAQLVAAWKVDAVIYESNFGGHLVRANLEANGVKGRILSVHASRGKHIRAEPIAALYEAGRVWHIREMPELEEQMLHMTPQGWAGEKSPDRLDACVFAITALLDNAKVPGATVVARKS